MISSDVTTVSVKGNDYRIHILCMSKDETMKSHVKDG